MDKIVRISMRAIEPLDGVDKAGLKSAMKEKLTCFPIEYKGFKINVWISDVDPIYQKIHDWEEKAWMYDDSNDEKKDEDNTLLNVVKKIYKELAEWGIEASTGFAGLMSIISRFQETVKPFVEDDS